MELVWHGTACIEVRGPEGRLLFDPFVPLAGSPVDVRLEDFDGFSDVLVTHGHFDHLASIPAIYQRNPGMRVWCTRTSWQTLRKKGIPTGDLRLIAYGDALELGGMTVSVFHGRHAVLPRPSGARLRHLFASHRWANLAYIVRENRRCQEADETVLYQITGEGRRVCLMGSLNLRDDVAYPEDADLLVLPYNGWDDNLPPAVRTIERLRPRRVVLDHYDDTFPPITMPLDLAPILERYPHLVTAGRLGEPIVV